MGGRRSNSRARSKAANRRTERHAIALPADRAIKAVVVADTHSNPHLKIGDWLAREAPDFIVHGGDIGAPAVLDALAAVAPVYAVRGNIDGHAPHTPDVMLLDLMEGEATRLRIVLTHIAVYGPRLRQDARILAQEHEAQMVICGHSHVPLIARDGPRIVFNPGSIGPRRFALPITFGVLRFGEQGLDLHHVSCETGERWLPPAVAMQRAART